MGAGLAVMALAGCANAPVTAPVPTPAPATAPPSAVAAPSTPAMTPDQQFLVALALKGIAYGDRESGARLGRSVCTAAEGGANTPMLVAAARGTGYTPDEAWAILVAAHTAYCPTLTIPGG